VTGSTPPETVGATAPGPAWSGSTPRALLGGALAGLASGLFGVGGGVVLVPLLVVLVRLDQRMAHGTSLAAIVPIAASGTIGYALAGEVDWPLAALTAAGALVGTPLGARLLHRLPLRTLRVGFALVLFVTAARMFASPAGGDGREAIDLVTGLLAVATGLASGLLAGVMGVGGGVLLVPIFALLFGLPLVLAKGTSLAVIVPGAIAGTLRNRSQGTTDLRTGLIAGAGGILAAAAASRVSLDLDPTLSSSLFAALLTLTALRIVLRERRAGDH
jgi:hypothetical protein